MNREQSIARLRDGEDFDLLVVGGGATGLGTAVDAASRGYRVALVEAHDFAKGTSSRSTKLVHGGVRYLKQGDLPLVFGALRERALLAANAPQLVRELRFVIPAYSRVDRPFYGAGLKLYDLLALHGGFGRSRILGRDETIERLPTVSTQDLRGGVSYSDGQFDDARLAIALARTATAHGAVLANYVEAVGLIRENGRICGCRLRDGERGDEFELRARVVVNATGIFADQLRHRDDPSSEPVLTVSQGVHLVLSKRFLPGDHALMIPKTSDGRVLFAIPWHGRVVLGTTDTPRSAPEIEPRALPDEIDFLIEHAERHLDAGPVAGEVLSVFAGLRPLVRRAGTTDTARLSRDHRILVSRAGLVTVTGGKWTTYRRMAEDVVDRVVEVADLEPRPCRTASLRLEISEDESADDGSADNGSGKKEQGDHRAPLHKALPICAGDVERFVRNEMARSVEDVLSRRSRCLLLDAAASAEVAQSVASTLAAALGRDSEWERSQVEEFRRLALDYRIDGSRMPTSGALKPGSGE